MRKIEIITPVEAKSYDELTDSDRRLVDLARRATEGSYAP